ncbi:hypothetical protein SORBI_3001G343832 [Sorghum bicolor]|uniref:3-beta hydroxysteroid dehydrogenase/isomerase domain-containing protein n=1 Tax=Sorghum bicolor TaxID=4558 RepID=A0A1Z5S948_SORBI|nr:hypothetical protein SORBI_3001G343832 [Sorghum bicolor]
MTETEKLRETRGPASWRTSPRKCDDDNNGGRRETRWCAVTGGRGFMARHLVAALLRSGEWRVRVTDLTPTLVLGPGETEEIFGDALRDGRAIYASADVCNLEQLIKDTFQLSVSGAWRGRLEAMRGFWAIPH